MKDAVNMWYICRFNETFEFRDTCYSVHCHDFCPEEIDFLQNTSDEYPTWAIIVIVLIVVTITVLSLVLKVINYVHRKHRVCRIYCVLLLLIVCILYMEESSVHETR